MRVRVEAVDNGVLSRCKHGLLRPTGITSLNYASLVTFSQILELDYSGKMNCVEKEIGKVPNGETLTHCTINGRQP
ncbi:hypothetical protein PHMEG_00025254 [Phytophthora megakarya]|uniref:Uncharacterized protein n=1 Tax=Phytophthora megakarya TaxID=4795 RepID=A0A225VF11_9STRA|nr:hypothetical protein PHMEG_00025254 [Phytophthora megakarya]